MSREDWIAIASRLFAVFLAVTVARYIPSAFALIGQEGPQPSFILIAAVITASFAICALLWFFPLTVARKLLPVMKEPRSESRMDESTTLSVGLTVLGFWVLAYAVPDILYWITLIYSIRSMDAMSYMWTPEQTASVVTTVAEIAFGLWLVLGSSGIKRGLFRLRYGTAQNAA